MLSILLYLLFGALVGWLATKIMNIDLSLIWTIVLGIAGAFVGGWVASLIGLGVFGGTDFNIGNILVSLAGACLVVWIVGMVKRSTAQH